MECRALGQKPVAFSEWAGGQQEMALSDLGSEEELVASGLVQENSQELGDRWPGSDAPCLSLLVPTGIQASGAPPLPPTVLA